MLLKMRVCLLRGISKDRSVEFKYMASKKLALTQYRVK